MHVCELRRPGPLQLLSGRRPTSTRAPRGSGGRQEDSGAEGSGRTGVRRRQGAAGKGSLRAPAARCGLVGMEPIEERFGTAAGQVPAAAVGRGGTEPGGATSKEVTCGLGPPGAGGGCLRPGGREEDPRQAVKGGDGVPLASGGL
ncbi:hypothetical protein NDU88_003090 [Pleurodeles waltl]|uniref:Uncharacterized protein n=1 Tax=Pleurodeles waltl TaxID=8319 RepID=A0AAV7P8J8_PLEWA|nr:hypothetical protein NDU88_003090 [Pleurodeles waltl]